MKKILLSQLALLLILASCSEKGVEPPLAYPTHTTKIHGKVILENQTEGFAFTGPKRSFED